MLHCQEGVALLIADLLGLLIDHLQTIACTEVALLAENEEPELFSEDDSDDAESSPKMTRTGVAMMNLVVHHGGRCHDAELLMR